MIIRRLINGSGMDITSSTCPVFMAETSPSHLRGKLVVLGSTRNTVGFCTANWMNYGLYDHSGPFQWRFPLAFQLMFPLIVATFLPFIVELPQWLLLKRRQDEAKQALASLQRNLIDLTNARLNEDLRSIRHAIQDERKARVSTKDVLLFRDPNQNMRRLLLR